MGADRMTRGRLVGGNHVGCDEEGCGEARRQAGCEADCQAQEEVTLLRRQGDHLNKATGTPVALLGRSPTGERGYLFFGLAAGFAAGFFVAANVVSSD